MAHWRLVTARLVRDGEAGGELYVWTVDDAEQIRSLEAMGVTGVITNDPRLFGRHNFDTDGSTITSRAHLTSLFAVKSTLDLRLRSEASDPAHRLVREFRDER